MDYAAKSNGEARRSWLLVAGIVAVVVTVFLRARDGAFLLWDDDINITGNPHIRGLTWENLGWMFTNTDYMRRYVPLTWLNWAIDHALFGLTARSAHMGNILFHAANSVLVFFIVRRVLRTWRSSIDAMGPANFAAAIGAIVWALHPLRVEVVAWASGRIYCQTAFFLLLALFGYLKAAAAGARRPRLWLAVSATSFLMSMLTYPLGITFVGVLVVIDVWLLRQWPDGLRGWREQSARRSLSTKVPYALVTFTVLGITLLARYRASAMWGAPPTLEQFALPARVMQAFYVWAIYVGKTLLPFDLAPTYTSLMSVDPREGRFVVSAFVIIGLTAIVTWKRRQRPAWFALWLGHLILIAPFLGVTEHPHYANDRYSYLQGVLVAVVVSGGAFALFRHGRAWLAGVLGGAAIVGCAVLTFTQIGAWRSSETLFRHVITTVGQHPYRADMLWRLGNVLVGEQRFAEATDLFRATIDVNDPGPSSLAYVGLAKIAQSEERRQDALTFLKKASELNSNLYQAQVEMGVLLVQGGDVQAAQPFLKRATELRPDFAHPFFWLGLAHSRIGQQDDARAAFETATLRDPGSVDAKANLAITLNQLGRVDEAIRHCQAALRIAPHAATVHAILGDALSHAGRKVESIEAWREAVRLDPNLSQVHQVLGLHFAAEGQNETALRHFDAAIQGNPSFAEAHLNRGMILQSLGRSAEAVEALNTALRINPNLSAAHEALQRAPSR